MRGSFPFVLTLLLISLATIIPLVNGLEDGPPEVIIRPERLEKGSDVEIELLLINDTTSPYSGVRMEIPDHEIPVVRILSAPSNETSTAEVYRGSTQLLEEGEITIRILVFNESGWQEYASVNITVSRGGGDGGGFDFKNMYCAGGIILITLFVIFLTWSYFRGRRMQREGGSSEAGDFRCSECGRSLQGKEDRCPWCGVEITGDEFVCGHCGEPVDAADERCRACGSLLKKGSETGRDERSDEANEKRRKRSHGISVPLDDSIKRKCRKCGTILVESEKSCPVCGAEMK